MSRFGRLVIFLLAVVFFLLLGQWSYSGGEDPRVIWEETSSQVSEWWSPDDTHSHDTELYTAASQIRDE
jgi:hypothetical protein